MPRDFVSALFRRAVGGGCRARARHHESIRREVDSQLFEARARDLFQHHVGETAVMIIEHHYDEEVLIGLLEEPDHDSHVPGCETCAGTLESLRDLTSALRDNSVWDERQLSETPAPKTTNMLRAFAERTKAEDAAAATIVPRLIAAPAMIQVHPEWRTAGVVRKLLAVVDEKNFSEP